MIKLLFVDDEPMILEGIRRSLRPLRKEWEAEFTTSALSATEMLGARPFDVLVTDMRMPGMDGFELLVRALVEHPKVVRIALSGESELEAEVRSSGMAHDYLAKPCVVNQLAGTVQRLMAA